jgi:3-hydroxy-9,10-secoandrosta-1,3,5(10)-triene-9,17-dione monooxygenase reductase component
MTIPLDRPATASARTGDPRHFRDALSHFCSGITILAAIVDSVPVGLTCQSFFSVSLEPPLVAIAVSKSSTSFPKVRGAPVFSITVLAQSQEHISSAFAHSGTDKWQGITWQPGTFGAPLIDGSLAWLACSVRDVVDAGDHVLVLANVLDLNYEPNAQPLLYFRSEYRNLDHRGREHNGRNDQ